MGESYPFLDDLLNDCTVQVKTVNGHGTGFFVAPGLILTCAHVVREAIKQNSPVTAYCRVNKQTIPVRQIQQDDIFPDAYPDLALLRVDIVDHPCVLLGTYFHSLIDFYSYGYTKDHPDGESTTVECEGTQEDGGTFIKLKEGQVKPGSSGSPLLNKETGFVCGMIARTRDSTSAAGGSGVPVTTIFERFPDLERKNQAFHYRDMRWKALVEKEISVKRLNSAAARVFAEPGKISMPDYWVGRQELLVRLNQLLDQSHTVLLTGMGGIGKTSLAQVLVDERLRSGSKPIIWIETRREKVDVLLEALAKVCGSDKILAIPNTEEKKLALKDALDHYDPGLLVIDNASNIDALNDLLDAVPGRLPVLVTSRMRIAADDILDVGQLSPADALELLARASGVSESSTDDNAKALCQLFGYHPLALEIAGASMKEMQQMSPARLLERLKSNPVKLSSLRRGEIRPLLDECAGELPESLKTAFFAFGRFPANGLTPSLLAEYLNLNKSDLVDVLDQLVLRNLIKCRLETDFYYLHDLIFLYVKRVSKANNLLEDQSLAGTVIRYLEKNSNDYELITLDLSNVLAIADWSDQMNLIQIFSWLTLGGFPEPGQDSYIENKGYPPAFLERLDHAIRSCRKLDDCPKVSLHYMLGKRGDAFFNSGDFEHAISCYEEALSLAPSSRRQVVVTSVAAKAYAIGGDHRKAQSCFQRSYELAEPLQDDLLLVKIMEQECVAASAVGDFERIRDIATRQRETVLGVLSNDPTPLAHKHHFYALLNLGTAKAELAKLGKDSFIDALAILQQAQQVAISQKSEVLLAYALDSLADVYHFLERHEDAKASFEQALLLWKKLGMTGFYKELEMRMRSLGYQIPE